MGFIPGMPGWFNIGKPLNVMYHNERMRDAINPIISIDAEKTFNKSEHSFMIKARRVHFLSSMGLHVLILSHPVGSVP